MTKRNSLPLCTHWGELLVVDDYKHLAPQACSSSSEKTFQTITQIRNFPLYVTNRGWYENFSGS